jgi:hypothetical protein
MAKTKQPEILSDTALEIVVWPAKVKLRCDHAGVELREGHDPDTPASSAPDAHHLMQRRYSKKCDRFGKVEAVTLDGVDDPARACGGCEFNRTLVGLA